MQGQLLAPVPGVLHDIGQRHVADLLDDVHLAQDVFLLRRRQVLKPLAMAQPHVLDVAQPVVDQAELLVFQRRLDAAAVGVADDDHMRDPQRVDRVLDVLERYGIALEINARYRIPSFDIIRRAKQRGIKFTFGTNNVDADFGRLEYSLEAVEKCGLTADDIWFPAMSVRRGRPVVLYNKFE